jgi:hypothetical protein
LYLSGAPQAKTRVFAMSAAIDTGVPGGTLRVENPSFASNLFRHDFSCLVPKIKRLIFDAPRLTAS